LTSGVTVGRKSPEKEKGGSRRYATLVRLAADVVLDAKVLASMRDTSMAELLSSTLRPILRKLLEAEYRIRLEGKEES
jgi:hypothetical protein